jgi:homoserine kinase
MTVAAFVDGPVRVRVPATSANLGPGFDSLGLALALHDEVSAEVCGDGLRLEIDGEGSADVPRDETHLVVRSMHRVFDVLGVRPDGLRVRCHNRIPHSRGLGSSAAAIVAGTSLARALVDGGEHRMDDDALLALAAEIEGHPDNVAPCLLGGLTVAWSAGTTHALRIEVAAGIRPVLLVPPFTASTEAARGLLPATVAHADAAFAAGRAALLIAAMTGAPHAIFDATEDRLHQSFREPAMPASIALVAALRDARLPAVVSGAGPTVLILARDELEVESARTHTPDGWTACALPVDLQGASATRS